MRDSKHRKGLKALNEIYLHASNPHDHWDEYANGYVLALRQAQDAYATRTYYGFLQWHVSAATSPKLIARNGKYKQGYIDGLQKISEMINSDAL